MTDYLEKTPEAQRGHSLVTGPHPVVRVTDHARSDLFNRGELYPKNGAAMDPFEDDEPLECGIEDPESCESCQ